MAEQPAFIKIVSFVETEEICYISRRKSDLNEENDILLSLRIIYL